MGLWLASGFCWRFATYAAIVTFAGFAGVSLAKALGGEKSCGCLGEIESSPWMMAVLDGSILVLLARVRTKPRTISRPIGAVASLVWSLGFVALLWIGNGDREKTLEDVLPAEFRHGTWEVTVVRSGCLACMAHLREQRTRTRSAAAKRALLTLGEPEPWLEEFYDPFHSHYSVSSENSPKIKTPQKVWIADGVIVRSSSHFQRHVP